MELVIADDGSTDDTADRLARIDDPRLRIAALDKVGVGAARNHGLSRAWGEYIAFLDADDRWRLGKLSRQLMVLDSEPDVGFVFTNFPTRPSRAGSSHVIEGDTMCCLAPLSRLPCRTQMMVVRSGLIRGLTFPADVRLSQDLRFVLDVCRVARGAFIDEPLVEVRRDSDNSASPRSLSRTEAARCPR